MLTAIYESAGPYKCACGGWLLWLQPESYPLTDAPQPLVCADCHGEWQAPRWRLVQERMATAK